jgi:hypothetical protein
MAHDLDPLKLSSPRIFLVRMMVFLVLCALVVVILYKQIAIAFTSNVLLNSVIIFVLAVGIVLTFRQVIRLFPEVNWVNGFRLADPGLAIERPPVLLAPMASILGDRMGRMAISSTMMRGILDSIATRLDEARDISRYMTGLLVFLGLLGTFWGLIVTVGSVGNVINTLKVGGDAQSTFDSLREGLAAPCSAWPARWCWVSSICSPARPRTASTPTSRTGCLPRCATSAPAPRRAHRRARRRPTCG